MVRLDRCKAALRPNTLVHSTKPRSKAEFVTSSMFNLAIDSSFVSCDVVAIRVEDGRCRRYTRIVALPAKENWAPVQV